MNRNDLRQTMLAGAAELLAHTTLIRGERRMILEMQRAFWTDATEADLDRLWAKHPQQETQP